MGVVYIGSEELVLKVGALATQLIYCRCGSKCTLAAALTYTSMVGTVVSANWFSYIP